MGGWTVLITPFFTASMTMPQPVYPRPLFVQEESLAESFQNFSEYSLSLTRKIREIFPTTNSTAFARLEGMLR